MIKAFILVLLSPSIALAQHISIYDSETDKEKSVVEVSCYGREYRLVVKKQDLESREVERWFSYILRTKCKGF